MRTVLKIDPHTNSIYPVVLEKDSKGSYHTAISIILGCKQYIYKPFATATGEDMYINADQSSMRNVSPAFVFKKGNYEDVIFGNALIIPHAALTATENTLLNASTPEELTVHTRFLSGFWETLKAYIQAA